MILVTLGTQDKSFERLLKQIDKEIKKKIITEKVIVQAGYTKYNSKNMEIFDYKSKEDLENLVKKCNFMITHAGVGSILNGISNDKKVIAVPRLAEYQEHNNNHQIEIAREFSKEGYILYCEDLSKLSEYIKNIKDFKPKKLKHNNKIIKTIEDFIDNI